MQPLFDEPFMTVIPKGHRLAERSSISPKDLEEEHILLLERVTFGTK